MPCTNLTAESHPGWVSAAVFGLAMDCSGVGKRKDLHGVTEFGMADV